MSNLPALSPAAFNIPLFRKIYQIVLKALRKQSLFPFSLVTELTGIQEDTRCPLCFLWGPSAFSVSHVSLLMILGQAATPNISTKLTSHML